MSKQKTIAAQFDALKEWQDKGPIRKFRKKKKLTVTEFSDLVGCTFANVAYWERVGGSPRKHLETLADIMGIHPTTLDARIKAWREGRPS